MQSVIERWRKLYGNDSPDEAYAWYNFGVTLAAAGKHDEAIAAYRRALAIREARLGEVRRTTFTRDVLASELHQQGHWDEALELRDQALRAYRAQFPAGDRLLTRAIANRAETLTELGRLDEAAQGYNEAIALFERDGTDTVDLATTLYNRGELHRMRGQCPDALREYTRAASLAESHHAGGTIVIAALVGEAACLLRARHFDDATVRLDRALRLEATPQDAFQLALARAYLGRASVESRRDVAGGLAAVRSARAKLATLAEATNAAAVRELDAWLAAHAR